MIDQEELLSQPLRILIVDDSDDDAILLQRMLRRGGYKIACEVVDTAAAMRTLLENQNWDIITSDHAMPNFNAPEALALAKALCPEVTFIIVSGEINLNLAVSLMKGGAKDYIQKRELARIVPAIERELRDVALNRQHLQADKALIESEKRFREVLENSLDASYKRNLQTGLYEYLSPVFARISGYALNQMNNLPGETVMRLVHLDDLAEIERVIAVALSENSNSAFQVEYRFKHKEGQYRWLQDRFTVIRDLDGQAISLIGSMSDITERKLAVEALKESELKYRSLIEFSSDSIFCVDEKGEFQFTNQIFASNFGKTPDYFIGKTYWDVYPKDAADFRYETTKRVFQTGQGEFMEGEVPLPGKTLYFYIRINPIKDGTGKVISMLTHATDITDRRHSEEVLLAKGQH